LSTGRSEPLSLPGLPWPVEIRPHRQARSLRLRIDESRGLLTLTCPWRMSRRSALEWAQKQSPWVDRQLSSIEPPLPIAPGTPLPVEGRTLLLCWAEGLPRTPRMIDGRLECGGPIEGFAGRIERYLKAFARHRLSEETARVAGRCGVAVRSVSIGDATGRWGSCSSSGAIRYNWRLILAPPHLLRWVVAHEVAHRLHMNHGPAFRALEAELFEGDPAVARAELRALGPGLKRIGRGI